MKNNIVILSQPRTGSSFLCELFTCFKDTRVLYEFFAPGGVPQDTAPHKTQLKYFEKAYIYRDYSFPKHNELIDFIQANPQLSMDRLEQVVFRENRVIKTHLFQMNSLGLDFLITRPNTKFILLSRTNVLEQYVSRRLAVETGVFSSQDETEETTSTTATFSLDLSDYRNFKNSNESLFNSYRKKLTDAGQNFLELTYEDDLLQFNSSVMSKIQSWANSNNIPLERNDNFPSQFKKQNTRTIDQIVLNYDQIKDLL